MVADTRRARVAERHRRLRNKLEGTTERPRLAVFRSNVHMYAQIIDDSTGNTLVAVNTVQKAVQAQVDGSCANKTAAAVVGKLIAELALAKNITTVTFDRGGFNYHGRVQAVAEAAREAGLSF
ncbi:MAG: hypothetical protein WDW38_008029 [Sanguina aurantia]